VGSAELGGRVRGARLAAHTVGDALVVSVLGTVAKAAEGRSSPRSHDEARARERVVDGPVARREHGYDIGGVECARNSTGSEELAVDVDRRTERGRLLGFATSAHDVDASFKLDLARLRAQRSAR
jgi:hypothetical protein